MRLSKDWSPENITPMVPVKKEKKVRPTNSTHMLKSSSKVVVPLMSP